MGCKERRLFRGGSVGAATAQDATILRDELRIQMYIDLRSSEERDKDAAWHLLVPDGHVRVLGARGISSQTPVHLHFGRPAACEAGKNAGPVAGGEAEDNIRSHSLAFSSQDLCSVADLDSDARSLSSLEIPRDAGLDLSSAQGASEGPRRGMEAALGSMMDDEAKDGSARAGEETKEKRARQDTTATSSPTSARGSAPPSRAASGAELASAVSLGGGATIVHVSLLDRRRFVRGLLPRLPLHKLAAALAYKVLGWEESMRDVIVPQINARGLPMIYEILVDTAAGQLFQTLEAVREAADAGRPVFVFCKLGKDRTGVVSALLLAALGASEEDIVADYARSDDVHQMALGGIERMDDVRGMDAGIFSRAPPDAMRALLRYLGER
ncbi:hypothetical protein H632_c2986p0, partial [Helicosporidium sp. ATCC 50920]